MDPNFLFAVLDHIAMEYTIYTAVHNCILHPHFFRLDVEFCLDEM